MDNTSGSIAADLRAELRRRMPGYAWTIRKSGPMTAIGTMSSGMNRLSTLHVHRMVAPDGSVSYEAAVHDRGIPGGQHTANAPTVAQALRLAQDYCEIMARDWGAVAARLQQGRIAPAAEAAT